MITTVALLLVEANQEQGSHWDLAQYAVAYLALFSGAHLTIRRFTPYADPLLLPVVALLNGLGLVDDSPPGPRGGRTVVKRPGAAQRQSADAVDPGRGDRRSRWWSIFLRDHRMLARYGYVCGSDRA